MSVLVIGTSFLVTYMCWKIWDNSLEKLKTDVPADVAPKEVQQIYNNIARVTEVSNRVPPFRMYADLSSYLEINAFTTGKGVYLTYLADKVLTKDEKAVVLGHEIAHVILHHTDSAYDMFVTGWSNENELMADNVGASWADKAGYNVCKGREVFLKFYLWGGNSLNAEHPPNTLRYENLAHYCKDNHNEHK